MTITDQYLANNREYAKTFNGPLPLPPAKKTPWVIQKAVTVAWFFVFALPWIFRRIRGKSSGDGRVAKYPTPVKWPLRSR